MSQYAEVYEALRKRIESGEFAVGDQLPSISELQRQYGIQSLNTVRSAQQMLVEDGMIETHQGRGAFVTSTTSARLVDVDDVLAGAIQELQIARAAYAAQRVRRVTIDLDHAVHGDAAYFILTDALRSFVADSEARLQDDDALRSGYEAEHIAAGNWLLELIENALDGPAKPGA